MSEPDATEAQRWMRYAREDLFAAKGAVALEGAAPRHACWLAQQAAEKAIKAALVLLEIDYPRAHDLDALRSLLPKGSQFQCTCSDLAELTEWAVEARYPGDWPEATQADADLAVRQAATVVGAIELEYLGPSTH